MHILSKIILRLIITGMFLSIGALTKSQEMWGLTASNFAGSTGAILNPASIANSKLYMDINLITANAFFENNYGYIHKEDYSLIKMIGPDHEFPEYGPDEMPFDHFTDKKNKFVYASELLRGPSMMLAYGRHAFAFHTGARVLTSIYRLPYHIANFGYYGLDYTQQHNINYTGSDFGTSALVMGEIGLTYAFAFRRFSNEDWSAGITLKRMFSLGGGYLQANDIDYMVLNDSTINIRNMNAELGYSFPMNYDNNDFPYGPWIKGGGFGVDIGFTFQNKLLSYQKRRISKLCRQKYVDYVYRVGISIIDLGFVNMTSNAQVHSYDDVSEYWVGVDTLNYYNFNQLTRTLSEVFYNDPAASLVADKVRVPLPAALSLQADYKVHKNWYAGAVFIQPVRLGKSYLRRPAQIALVPRYETPDFEFSVPLSIYDWKYPRLGASVRYHFLSLGTDDLLGLVGLTNFTGLDFYVSVKINFRKGNCGRFNRNVPCENDEYGIRKRR